MEAYIWLHQQKLQHIVATDKAAGMLERTSSVLTRTSPASYPQYKQWLAAGSLTPPYWFWSQEDGFYIL